MMRSSPNPRANNIWTKEIIEIMIIILASLHFIMSQFYFFRISPQDDRTQDSTPGIVFDSHQDIGNIYHREAVFLANYAAMERDFKIFVYSDRRQKKCYNPKDKLKSNYASEHHFLKNLIPSRFFTDDPTKAHLFFIPFSCQEDKEIAIWAHVQGLIFGYPFWNRTLGTDHFFFSCHDIVSRATEGIPIVTKNAIRLFCSSNYDSKYIPHKDVSVPQALELSLPPDHGEDVWSWSTVESRPFQLSPEDKHPPRTKLRFWAGSPNSYVRKHIRIFHEGDPEFNFHFINKMQSSTLLETYHSELYGSKFCICPRGKNQVGSVCLTESMIFECIPVLMSDYYDLPFNGLLDWNNFSVILKEKDVPNLERIVKGIPEEKYKKMHQNLLQVSKHFKWNSPPVKYDLFHMVMYELWLRHNTNKYDLFQIVDMD